VRALGERHGRYGVTDSHYDEVGAALIQTLREGLGEAFDEALESAWATAYAFLAERMIAASRAACAASAA
jgi:hemoglobin-like flavoprotein